MWFPWLTACDRTEWSGDGPEIAHLRLEDVPNTLAVRVRFDTSAPADGAVEFGPVGELPRFRVEDHGGEAHELVVFGLEPDTAYAITACATRGRGESRSAPEEWSTPPLPDAVGAPELLVGGDPRSVAGWTMFDLNSNGEGSLHALMVDADARVVWLHDPQRGEDVGAVDVKPTSVGTILVAGSVPTGERGVEVDLGGEVVWEGPQQPGFEDDGFQHHHTDRLANGNYVSLEKDVRDGVRGDRVVVRDPSGARVWSWSGWDHLVPDRSDDEWTHVNWVELRDDVFFLSDEKGSTIWKIDRATGEPIWAFGAGGDFTLTQGTWFRGQHAPEWGPDGRLWVYDNAQGSPRSRVVVYTLDEERFTATEDWAWDGGTEWRWYTGYWGDVDVLPGGNLLVSMGNPTARRVLEVEPASGDVVWGMELPAPFGLYRAERVDPARWGLLPAPSEDGSRRVRPARGQ